MTTALLAMTGNFLQCHLKISHFINVKYPGLSFCSSPLRRIKVNASALKCCVAVGARLQEKSEQMQDRRLNIYRYIKLSVWLIPMLIIQ